jgi:hypothetical protein
VQRRYLEDRGHGNPHLQGKGFPRAMDGVPPGFLGLPADLSREGIMEHFKAHGMGGMGGAGTSGGSEYVLRTITFAGANGEDTDRELPERTLPQLLAAVRDSHSFSERIEAARALFSLANAQPMGRKAIAEKGGMKTLLDFFVDVRELTWDLEQVGHVWDLAHILILGELPAVLQLKEAVLGPQADISFMAIFLLQVRKRGLIHLQYLLFTMGWVR